MSVEETSLAAWEWLLKPKHHKGIKHSFRGVQYASKKFTNVVDSYKITPEVWVEKGTVGTMQSKTLKTEQIYGNKLISKEQMERYIWIYWNLVQ
jgi:hypothetical protein